MKRLKYLFEKCLNAEYIHTAECGDYSIEIDGNTLYLLFECSDDIADWKNNFDFPAKPYKRMGRVWFCHRGFLKVWTAMKNDIEEQVIQILNDNLEIENIVCVGYSHGGALAVLATEDMEYLYGLIYNVEGYGFGAPRVLWGYIPEIVKHRLRNFTTIRNIPDIVTHVPPKILGYRDINIKEIGEEEKYKPIEAHYSSSYIEELK